MAGLVHRSIPYNWQTFWASPSVRVSILLERELSQLHLPRLQLSLTQLNRVSASDSLLLTRLFTRFSQTAHPKCEIAENTPILKGTNGNSRFFAILQRLDS